MGELWAEVTVSQINLNQYIEQIKNQFEKGQYAEVVAHCRQILKSYPRYLEAYRLMGNALTAQKATKDAENVLYRVLSIDVSDFWAHRNLSQIFADTNQLEKAIWHIEHAFEIDPNNVEVAESREQYYRRAAIPAPVVKGMPLASVARLYVKGGIYDQAIEELNRMLAHNPDRLDWKTLLAIAYWREGKNADALQLAENILEKLPNNYYARLVLGDIWWHNGRNDIANGHLDILQQILLLDASQTEKFPLAAPTLETSGKIGQPYLISPLSSTDAGQDPLNWQSPVEESEAEEPALSDILSDLESDPSEAGIVITEDDDFISEFDLDYDKDSIGTGPLEAFANDMDQISDELGEADNPDPLTDSELSRLPDIDNLMTAELDHSVNEDEATLESISDELDALSVSSIEELAELDRQHRANAEVDEFSLTEDDFGLSDEDFGISDAGDDEDDFFIDLTIEDALSDSVDSSVDSDEPADQEDAAGDLAEDIFADLPNFEEEEELILTSDFPESTNDAITEKNKIPELSDDLDDGDSLEWLDQDLPEEIFDESQSFLDATFEPDSVEPEIETPSLAEDDSTNTGFTDWLEAVDIPEDPAEEEMGSLEDLFAPINDSTNAEPTLAASESPAAVDNLAGDGSDDAFASGLFDFLSDEENQLNPLPEAEPAIDSFEESLGLENEEIKGPDWEIDFDEYEVEDAPQISAEIEAESTDGGNLDFLETVQSEADISDDPFDTSWLDSEMTEEIDLLSEQSTVDEPDEVTAPAEDDLRSFAEKLDGDFDRLAPSDSNANSEPDFNEDGNNDFPSKPQLDPTDPDISAEAADLHELLEQANHEVRNASTSAEFSDSDMVDDLSALTADAELVEDSLIDEVISAEETTLEDVSEEVIDEIDSDSSLDWLIPEGDAETEADLTSDDEDLGWLSLLDEGIPETEEPKVEEVERNLPWTGDLSSAASSILMPESGENETKELTEDESPDWLNELPEYNTPSKQTDKLATNSLEDKDFDDDLLNEDLFEDDLLDFVEDDQEFDPIVFQESSSKQLPEWLADATLSASLGYEPESSLESVEEKSEEAPATAEIDQADAEQNENVNLEKASPESEFSLEDELDMEFDKNGNPIPPESHDLEDTLNWLEELATIDLDGDSSKIAINSKDSASKVANIDSAEPNTQNDDPLSEIFSGGSALHAFANLESESPDLVAEEQPEVDDQTEVSKETLNWLDNLFSPGAAPDAQPDQNAAEVVDEAQASLEDIAAETDLEAPDDLFDELNSVEVESAEDLVDIDALVDETAKDLVPDIETDTLPEDIFSELSDEAVLDLDDLELEIEDGPVESATEALDAAVISEISETAQDSIANVEEAVEDIDVPDVALESSEPISAEVEAAEPAKRGGGMFGVEDITVSQEEISRAVESGDVVPGMEDIPDDPEALMAWLNLEPEVSEDTVSAEQTEVVEDSTELVSEAVEAIESEPAEVVEESLAAAESAIEIEPEVVEPAEEVEQVVEAAQEPKRPSMFGDSDDITVTAEEISEAVEHGDVVPGMEDIPDDPDALMAWLDLSIDDSGSEENEGLDLDLTENIESTEADLIIADLGQDSEPVLETKVGSAELNLDRLEIDDGLDELFDDIAGPEGTAIEDEDLIFGDLGTGRLSGSDWLDQMTFDSDPALLGDVPTVLPSAPNIDEIVEGARESAEVEDILDEAASDLTEGDLAVEAEVESAGELPSLEELPDDPDEFIRILESNVDEPEVAEDENAPLPVSFDEETEASAAVDAELSSDGEEIPDWLKVDEQESDPALPWLDDASSSGVMSWLDADQAIKEQGLDGITSAAQSTESVEQVDPIVEEVLNASEPLEVEPESIFEAVPVDTDQEFSAKVEEYKQKLSDGDDLPTLIREVRELLTVKNDPVLQKILGDAYMETGQLQDALDAYRQAQRLL